MFYKYLLNPFGPLVSLCLCLVSVSNGLSIAESGVLKSSTIIV